LRSRNPMCSLAGALTVALRLAVSFMIDVMGLLEAFLKAIPIP